MLVAYAVALGIAVATLAGALILSGWGVTGPAWLLIVLAGAAFYAERQPVRVSASVEMTVSVLPVLFGAVLYGPLAAMVIAVAGLLGDFRSPYTRWAIWTCLRALSGGLAGVAAAVVLTGTNSFGRVLAAVAVAVATEAFVDAFLGSIVVMIRGTGSFKGFLESTGPILCTAVPLYSSVIALLAYAYQGGPSWSVLLFFGPAFAAHSLYRLSRVQRETLDDLAGVNRQLEQANLSFASALVATLDARDRYTAGHSAAVAVYARDIAARLGLSDREQDLAHLCGLVHDIGKIGLPPGLLEKPGPLTLDERRVMEKHSEIGERILSKVEDYAEIARIVRHHHERVDGNGYPDGLAGAEIPLLARVIAVADAYNAMTSDRPYRDAMPSRVARLRLAQAVESQFDTTVVAAFEAILAGAAEAYRSGLKLDLDIDIVTESRPLEAAVA